MGPEATKNPNPRLIVDPPWPLRGLISAVLWRFANPTVREKKRARFEARRKAAGARPCVEYFHQLDDPYSHLTAQLLRAFAARYDIDIVPHLVSAAGGLDQPEGEKLAVWARRDCALIAPHYGLDFPFDAPTVPDPGQAARAAEILAPLAPDAFVEQVHEVSAALWSGALPENTGVAAGAGPDIRAQLQAGADRLAALGHYSGATFYYGGEFYWGIDRLFHLEKRLMALGLRKEAGEDYLAPRPSIDGETGDASNLTLHFFPSLNSPYTSIIYDKTVALANAWGVKLEHKPVLPMVMRGVPATRNKTAYIMFDTRREAEHLGVPFGPFVMPIGTPTRRAYSLFAWARTKERDTHFMSALLRLAFTEKTDLSRTRGMRRAVEAAGLDWAEAVRIIGNDDWQDTTAAHQQEMMEGMRLWGVPSYRLSGPDGEPDLNVWGQDRLWLVAAEIRRRAHGPA